MEVEYPFRIEAVQRHLTYVFGHEVLRQAAAKRLQDAGLETIFHADYVEIVNTPIQQVMQVLADLQDRPTI